MRGAAFHCSSFDYSLFDWVGFCIISDNPWKNIFNLSDSVLLFEWFQDAIDVFFLHEKYQVKPHSTQWFPPARSAVITYRYLFLCFLQIESVVFKPISIQFSK